MLEALPLTTEPKPGESGLGYCLRAVTQNGLSLHWIRAACGLGYTQLPTAESSRILSGYLGCDNAWLSFALPRACSIGGRRGWTLHGHLLLSKNHMRISAPQLCPLCVHQYGYCRAAWEYALCTICVEHGVPLIDHCGRCRSRLRWDRPSVDICNCGWAFKATESMELHELSLASSIARFIDARVWESAEQDNPLGAPLPPFLRELSPGGLFIVTHALGACLTEYAPVPPQTTTKMLSTKEWRAVVARAAERLGTHGVDAVPTGGRFLAHSILNRLLTSYLPENDREVAHQLLQGAFYVTRPQVNGMQLELFGSPP